MKTNKKRSIVLTALLFVILGCIITNSCTHQPYVLPLDMRSGDPNICFERDVLPIFQSNCAKSGCHDAGSRKGGYQLDSYQDIIKKGIVPGNPAASKIWESISMNIFGVQHMPVESPDLTASQLCVIRQWIATGAIDSGACNTTPCDTTTFTYSGAIAPIMQLYCTGCHNSSSASGGSLLTYADVMNAALNGRMIGDISHLSGYNAMPPTGTTLQDCQVTQIKKWVAAGAPNN